jgi:ribosome-binding ATPase YchF (GTP1/OBG family)
VNLTRNVPVTLVDVAGLVPGAHEGRGLGNQFLTDLNEADVLVHVVDFAVEADLEGEQTENHDPREDIDFLEREPDMWYLDILEKALKRADEQGAIEYSHGAEEFSIGSDVSDDQAAGLDQIRGFVEFFGGTGVQQPLETALFDEFGAKAVFPGDGSPQEDGTFLQDCFILPEDATAEEFAYFLHTDIGEGVLQGIDARSGRQVGADTELGHRDVLEVVTTN